MRYFNHLPVLAFTSDASIDFTPACLDSPLTRAQQEYLKAQTGWEIPQVFWRKQVHGHRVIPAQGRASDCAAHPPADGFVTNQQGLPIAIRTADCLPVFIFDPVKKALGLAHAGWKGTKAQIAVKTIKTMQDKFGSRCYDLQIGLGPAIRGCCYKVGGEFKDYFPQDLIQREGELYLDMIAANRRQLLSAGVLARNIFDSQACTSCDRKYFSFRRDGEKAGRMVSVMMLL